MDHQDWAPVVLSKKSNQASASAARKKGVVVIPKTIRKALEDDGQGGKIETIDRKISMRIQQARSEKGMQRKALAQRIGVKDTVLADYENGKAIPSAAVLNKIERIVGRSVRRD